MSNEPDALRLAKGLRDNTLLLSERDEAAEVLERLHAEAKDWSDRACNLQHELNISQQRAEAAREIVRAQIRTIESLNAVINDAGFTTTENLSIVGRLEARREADERLLREALTALQMSRSDNFVESVKAHLPGDNAIAALRKRLGE